MQKAFLKTNKFINERYSSYLVMFRKQVGKYILCTTAFTLLEYTQLKLLKMMG